MNQTISASKARNNFSQLLSQVIYQQQEFTIQRNGKQIAKIVPINPKTATKKIKQTDEWLAELKQNSLGISDWNQAKQLLDDLQEPSVS